MPLPQLTLPAGTPHFRARGHGVEQSSQFAHPRFQTGHSRARRVWTASERLVTVSLLLRRARMAAFHAWYEGPLADANGRFSALVANDETVEAKLLWYAAEFEGVPTYTPRGPQHWVITATLRLTGAGQAEGPYTGELTGRDRVVLIGSVRATVVPQVIGADSVVLLQQLWLRGADAVALEQAE